MRRIEKLESCWGHGAGFSHQLTLDGDTVLTDTDLPTGGGSIYQTIFNDPGQYVFEHKVGYKTRYKKNMVVDGNGQVSVSYLDAQGRVVATALSGSNETDFVSLDSETDGNHVLVKSGIGCFLSFSKLKQVESEGFEPSSPFIQ